MILEKYLFICQKMVLDLNKNIIFVDTSYLVFYRFFALKKWIQFAHKDIDIKAEGFKWMSNKIFMEKFEKTLLDTIKAIAKKQKVPLQNIVFGLDCHFKDNWRLKYCSTGCSSLDITYKGDRKSALKKQSFNEYQIFELVETKLLPAFAKENDNLILKHKNAEADDCIALGIKQLINKEKFKNNIFIIASDFDYIQICGDQVQLIDLKKKRLDQKELEGNNLSNKEYLIRKIMIGDKSDNINPCHFNPDMISEINTKCQMKLRKNKNGEYNVTEKSFQKIKECQDYWPTILEYFNNNKTVLKNNKTQNKNLICLVQETFDFNQRIIDFDLIPSKIKINLKIK